MPGIQRFEICLRGLACCPKSLSPAEGQCYKVSDFAEGQRFLESEHFWEKSNYRPWCEKGKVARGTDFCEKKKNCRQVRRCRNPSVQPCLFLRHWDIMGSRCVFALSTNVCLVLCLFVFFNGLNLKVLGIRPPSRIVIFTWLHNWLQELNFKFFQYAKRLVRIPLRSSLKPPTFEPALLASFSNVLSWP